MKSSPIVLGCAVAIMVLCGCSSHEAALEAKRQFAIDRERQTYSIARSPIFQRWGTNILSALSSTNAIELKRPEFASATMGRDQTGEYRLWVFWLEDRPSVDSVELRLANANSTAIVPISQSDREENIKTSKVSLVMVGSWVWHNTDNIWNKLEKIDDVSNIRIRLSKGSDPVTDWCPVSFYRLDHWMGSKEIVEVTTGSSVK